MNNPHPALQTTPTEPAQGGPAETRASPRASAQPSSASAPRVDDPAIAHHIVANTGQEGLALARFLEAQGPRTDLQIIEGFSHWKPSQVRRTLYRLQDSRAAQYVKDTDSTGWDTFLWYLCLGDVRDALSRRVEEEALQARRAAAAQADGIDFTCGAHPGRIPFGNAVDLRFLCPSCQAPLQSCEAPWSAARTAHGAVGAPAANAGLFAAQVAEAGAAC